MSKSWIIFVDGVDKSGKSTLIKELNKATNYRHTIIDRGPLSTAVYIDKFDRNESSEECINNLNNLLKTGNVIQILCRATSDKIVERVKLNNEKDYGNFEDPYFLKSQIIKDLDLFNIYYNKLLLNAFELDTSYNSIYNCVESICNTLDLLEKEK